MMLSWRDVFMWEHSCVDCVSSVFWSKGCFWYGCQPYLSSEWAGCYPLDSGYDWFCCVQSPHCWLGGASSLLCGCHSPFGGGVCSPVFGVEALRVRFNKAPLPLSVCLIPKEVTAAARWLQQGDSCSKACVVMASLCASCAGIQGSAQKKSKFVFLSLLC